MYPIHRMDLIGITNVIYNNQIECNQSISYSFNVLVIIIIRLLRFISKNEYLITRSFTEFSGSIITYNATTL